MDRRITPDQWVLHLKTAEHAGVPLSAYADEHGLNAQRLYATRQRRHRRVARQGGSTLDAPSAFATVQIKHLTDLDARRGADHWISRKPRIPSFNDQSA